MIPFAIAQLGRSSLVGAPGVSNKWRIYIDSTQDPGKWTTFAEVAMHATAGGPNICSGGTASASGTSGSNTAAKAFDGNTATKWQSGATAPTWIEYDFAGAHTIEEVVLTASSAEPNDMPIHGQVQYWNGAAWVTYFEFYTNSNWAASESRTFTRGSTNTGVSRWRLNITAHQSSTFWTSIAEVQLRTSIGGANAATGGAAEASAVGDTQVASQAFDGNTGTQWQSGTSDMPQQLIYYFPSSVTIVEVAITAAAATDAPTAFDLQYWDGAAWQTAFSKTTPATWVDGEQRVFH